jgi:outer membrane lipoprotein-sorting protein
MTAGNPETKNNYLIISDKKNFFIHSANAKKVIRTIPRKEGNTFTYIYPAKEGHIMVSEYNRKEKATTVSIEAL